MIDQKIKINATISYLFLGELFLLARNNPNFNNDFVKSHSKNAVKIHLYFFLVLIIYNFFLAQFFYYKLIVITLDNIFQILIYLTFLYYIVKWSYIAYKWEGTNNFKFAINIDSPRIHDIEWRLSETDKIIYLGSFIPFLWLIVWQKNELSINSHGTKLWSIFWIIMLLCMIFNHPNILLILGLFYIIIIAYLWIMILVHDKIIIHWFIDKISSLNVIYTKIKVYFIYGLDFLKMIFTKKKELDIKNTYSQVVEKEKKFDELASTYLTSTNVLFSNKIIFVPILNFIYLPKYFVDKKSRYILAIAQWIIISTILIIIWYFFWLYSENQLILLFPIFLWLANIDKNPFFRIPVIFEIYTILDKLSFGIFGKIKFLKEKKWEIKEVSFKV